MAITLFMSTDENKIIVSGGIRTETVVWTFGKFNRNLSGKSRLLHGFQAVDTKEGSICTALDSVDNSSYYFIVNQSY